MSVSDHGPNIRRSGPPWLAFLVFPPRIVIVDAPPPQLANPMLSGKKPAFFSPNAD
jgi:hypothetical protein